MERFIPKSDGATHRRLVFEGLLVRERFPVFSARLIGNQLICRGRIRPAEFSQPYRVEMSYRLRNSPHVRIVEPAIKAESKLHFYEDGTLCLYDWREQPWQTKFHLADTVVPWTAEWLLYYELYLLTGKWLGASAIHGTENLTQVRRISAEPEMSDDHLEHSE
jgi:hypothetical protein